MFALGAKSWDSVLFSSDVSIGKIERHGFVVKSKMKRQLTRGVGLQISTSITSVEDPSPGLSESLPQLVPCPLDGSHTALQILLSA